ncbi:MAG: hypothetical protein KF878_07585 [Planctomycetes bacterium]|nr:hypothetical protein [Planctomycetota bacterium]
MTSCTPASSAPAGPDLADAAGRPVRRLLLDLWTGGRRSTPPAAARPPAPVWARGPGVRRPR